MSDSDEDLMPNNVLKYQRNPAVFNATNFNNTNITRYTFKNNMMGSTFNNPLMERQRYEMRGFDQRSMYYGRETSPMSLRSFPDSGIQNVHNSMYTRGMSSQRSVFNGRSGSSVSMRSINSNATVSATDIALALENDHFNKYDLSILKNAFNKFMKNRLKNRIGRRRNLKLFLKNYRRRSGEDSGEQGSDSSVSSDDCRSSRTIIHKENIPKTLPMKMHDLSHFRMSMKDMNNDCNENLKQNSLQNMFTVKTLNHNNTTQEKPENSSVVTLKDRFAKGSSFLLPSQRFDKSKIINNDKSYRNVTENPGNINNGCIVSESIQIDIDSEKEEIFSENMAKANDTIIQRKRVLEVEETNNPARKRTKTAISPIKQNTCSFNDISIQKNNFNFKRPNLPVRKSSKNNKSVISERLIAKSHQAFSGSLGLDLPITNNLQQTAEQEMHPQEIQNNQKQNSTEMEPDCTNPVDITHNTTSDVSMKPSFLKRKLFTQKLDVVENKNISSDNLVLNSPQTKIYSASREKNKVRKLVSSQSCLNHDILGDDNVLDLIHKIVPPNQMNITNATNRKVSKGNHEIKDDWDVASVLSTCNIEEGSDTYTDEEIFKVCNANKTNNKQVNKNEGKQTASKPKTSDAKLQSKCLDSKKLNCKVVLQKIEPKINSCVQDTPKIVEPQCPKKRTVASCVRSFWDTDFESDMEEGSGTTWTSKYQINLAKEIQKDLQAQSTSSCPTLNFNKKSALKGTILTVRSFRNKALNSSMRSDISKVTRKNDIEKQEENNNKTIQINTTTKQHEEIKTKPENVPSTKTQMLKNGLNNDNNNKKLNSKQNQTKEKTTNKKSSQNNKCNTSRESLRLKQKKENAKILNNQINDTTAKSKQARPKKTCNEETDVSIHKKSNLTNKTSKNKSNKDTKTENLTINNATKNRTQTPRKCNEKKQLSSSNDQSSLNISNNISNRSLRVRRKVLK